MIGLIGIKEGMSRVFTEDGNSVPVTVVKIDSNVVTQIKKIDSEGYSSVQYLPEPKKKNISQNPKKPISTNQTLLQQKQLKNSESKNQT